MTMTADRPNILRLLSWNILAPCWVHPDWYPEEYETARQHTERIKNIAKHIESFNFDIVLIQEAQADTVPLLESLLGSTYDFHVAWNNPSSVDIPNGLLTLIRKDWIYKAMALVIGSILDENLGEAIQIITIPSKNLHIVNLHLSYHHALSQGKMVLSKCQDLLGNTSMVTIMAGDMNAETDTTDRFEWHGYQDVFHQTAQEKQPTYYPDPGFDNRHTAVDHIFYDPKQVRALEYGKAWNKNNGSLKESLSQFGSDHLYVWATFELS